MARVAVVPESDSRGPCPIRALADDPRAPARNAQSPVPMTIARLLLVFSPALALTASALFSYGTGVFPGKVIPPHGPIPMDVTRQLPGCAGTSACHRVFPGGNNLRIQVQVDAWSLDANQAMTVTTSSTGGTAHPQNWGGFIMEATAGAFTAGSNTQIDTPGQYVTHLLASNSNGRQWSYGYTAPATPGLVELYAVVNTVNGDGQADGSDVWGFFGINSGASINTPVRLYVNAPGVTRIGNPCTGSFGNVPVLGSKTNPTVGNPQFAIELHGATTSATAALLIGANPTWQSLDLSLIGITGCFLHVDALLNLALTTSAGDLLRGEGTATWPLPLPNDPSMRGQQVQVQAAIIDTNNGRALPITTTNGLRVTFQ
jgi:hypothetical protein